MTKEKVTLYFRGGNQLTFKCKSFTIRKSNDEGSYYSSASIDKLNETVTFDITEVVGVKIKKVLF